MKTFEGIAKHPGTAMAVAALVDAASGINGISSALLMEGITALRRGLQPVDYPEAILVCDSLKTAESVRIAGINLIGIAAESAGDAPLTDDNIPCVVGVSDLMHSVAEGDIVIVDGYKGRVYIDPDPSTLIHFQQAEEQRQLREKVFISSEHIPARTQSGEIVYVYARISKESQLASAMRAGADGLLVDLRNDQDNSDELSHATLREAAGKPVTFVIDYGCEEILRAAMAYCIPGQVTLVSEAPDLLASQAESAMDRIVLDALQLDIDPPDVQLGGFYTAANYDHTPGTPAVIDCRNTICVSNPDEQAIVVVGGQVDSIGPVVSAGARRIAVDDRIIAEAKHAVLTVGSGEYGSS